MWFSQTVFGERLVGLLRWVRMVLLTLKKTTKGSKLSRLFRFVFELKFIRTIMGTAGVVVFLLLSTVKGSVGGTFGLLDLNSADLGGADQIIVLTEKGVGWPLGTRVVNQKFKLFHRGVDLDGEIGQPVKAVAPGVVEKVERSRLAYGNYVIINHGSGFRTLYAHLSIIDVVEGETVESGEAVGSVGSTGWSTGPHLHLEFLINEEAVDPLLYL